MPTKMYFENDKCLGATSGTTGKSYDADRQGFIHVEDSRDVATLRSGGYHIAVGVPKFSQYWVCDDCGFHAVFNHCSRCDSSSLRRVAK